MIGCCPFPHSCFYHQVLVVYSPKTRGIVFMTDPRENIDHNPSFSATVFPWDSYFLHVTLCVPCSLWWQHHPYSHRVVQKIPQKSETPQELRETVLSSVYWVSESGWGYRAILPSLYPHHCTIRSRWYPGGSLLAYLEDLTQPKTSLKSVPGSRTNITMTIQLTLDQDIRGSFHKFPEFFRMNTFIDSTHMKLKSPSK